MTFADTSTPPGVRLYPHDPTSFLPLLWAHLPHSITTYSTIRTNPWPRVDVAPGVSLSASASSDANAGRATQEGAMVQTDGRAAVPDSLLYGAVWATFPASQMPDPPDMWAMLIHLPPPQRNQTRLYCSLDRELLVAPRPTAPGETPPRTLPPSIGAGSADDGSSRGLETGSRRWRAGQDLMLGVVQTVVSAFPPGEKYIPLNTVWVDGVVRWLEDVELASMVHDAYDVWLAPERLSHARDTLQGDIRPGAGKEVDTTGLEVGPCRREDCEVIQSSREIKEGIAYYIARMGHTSVIRQSDTGQPVAWILTHAAGDLGALYTIDGFRRRGLAKWVVEERMRAGKTAVGGVEGGEVDDRLTGHVWVSWENVGSRRLWESMGWVRGWSARWVCVK